MKKVHFITVKRLQRSVYKVQAELRRHGFWDKKLAEVQVYLGAIGGAYGWQEYGGSGDIVVPSISASKIADLFRHRYTGLSDVLRHEFGHAVADIHRGLIHSKRLGFEKAFWALPGDEMTVQFDPEIHVTRYAATAASEDYAEVFMFYLKHGGRLPKRFDTKWIRKKWRFVERLGKRIGGR